MTTQLFIILLPSCYTYERGGEHREFIIEEHLKAFWMRVCV